MSDYNASTPQVDSWSFMQDTAAEFLSLPDEVEADFVCPGSGGDTRIFVVDAPEAVVAFFSRIMQNEPQRFNQMNRAFPLMFRKGTIPHTRLSAEWSRLSPITNTWPSGTVVGP